jgi:hypothetical protein
MTFKVGDVVRRTAVYQAMFDKNFFNGPADGLGDVTTIKSDAIYVTWRHGTDVGEHWTNDLNIELATEDIDLINHPPHYTGYEGFEVIQITEQLPFLEGNVVKYVLRAGRKDDALADLEKAEFYLKRLIQNTKEKA